MIEGADHVFTMANPHYYALLFGRGIDFIGKPVRLAVPEAIEQGLVGILDRVRETGVAFVGTEFPIFLTQPDETKKKFYLNFVYQPILYDDGSNRGILVVGHDVTEQVLSRKKVEEALASKDVFVAIASHELNTPITLLTTTLQLLKREIMPKVGQLSSPKKPPELVTTALRNVGRLKILVEDLLDVARIQAGKLNFNFEAMNVQEAISEVVSQFSEQLEQNHSRIDLQVAENIIAQWDKFRFEQVLVNLISNAIKYAPGKPIFIRVAVMDKTAVLSVEDLGPGIPRERQEKIFERFERATESHSISGLGLGLFIVRKIVNGHHGSIRVESAEGKGTKFIVELPLSPMSALNLNT